MAKAASDRVLLWDFDGTLAHRPGQWSAALLDTLRRLEPQVACELEHLRPHLRTGFPWHAPHEGHEHLTTAEAWWHTVLPLMEGAFVAIGVRAGRARELAIEARRTYLDARAWQVFDDVAPALAHLATCGWRHVILSNHVPELDDLVAAVGLAPHFAAVHTSARLGFEKPHPQAFARALQTVGAVREAWMIGDSYAADVVGAHNAGLRSILVRNAHPGARLQCASLSGVAALLAADAIRGDRR